MKTHALTPGKIARTIAAIPESDQIGTPWPTKEFYPLLGPTRLVVVSWTKRGRCVKVAYPDVGRIVVVREMMQRDGTITSDPKEVVWNEKGLSLVELVRSAIDWLMEVPS